MWSSIPQSNERQKEADAKVQDSIQELDRLVNRAVVHCETDEIGCNEIMKQWSEECKKPQMNNIPSCHDGRIANYLSKEPAVISEQTTMSQECKDAKEIMDQNRWAANHNDPEALGEVGEAFNDYNRMGCPSLEPPEKQFKVDSELLESQNERYFNQNLGLQIDIPKGWKSEISNPDGWLYDESYPYGIDVVPVEEEFQSDHPRPVMFISISGTEGSSDKCPGPNSPTKLNGLDVTEDYIDLGNKKIWNYSACVGDWDIWMAYHQPNGFEDKFADFEKFANSLVIKGYTTG